MQFQHANNFYLLGRIGVDGINRCLRFVPYRTKSHYAVLGLKPQADVKEIKESFYKLSKEHHPDLNKDESSIEKFREIAEAYETLINPELRQKYDQENGSPARQSIKRPPGRKFDGMRGTFRDGEHQ